MKHYPKYRCSSCDWLQSIPEEWSTKRIKSLFRLRDERSYKPLSEVNLISLYAGLGVRQQKDIERTTGNKARNADGYKIVYKNDIVVNILLCWMGAIGSSDYYGVTSPAYDVYKAIVDLNTKYYSYLFRTPFFSRQCYRNGKGIMAMRLRTYSPQFLSIVVPFPPRSEQDQIVKFLDWKVSCINKLISNYRNQIEDLEEMKLNRIDEVVIHGMQDKTLIHSEGIQWDIDYPKHWKLQRIKESFNFRKGLTITKENLEDTGVAVINYGQVHSKSNFGVGLNETLIKYVNHSYLNSSPSCIVEKGDFIFADTSEDITGCGNCAYIDWDEKIFAGYHTIIAHPNSFDNSNYLAYLFLSPSWRYQIRRRVNGVKVFSITQKMLKNVYILIPPVKEQNEIVRYLDDLCSKINIVITNVKEKISNLEELKNNLIADVVIGKIDVRNIEIPEYEFVEEETDSDVTDSENEEGSEE